MLSGAQGGGARGVDTASSKASFNPVPRATSIERRTPTTWSRLDLGNYVGQGQGPEFQVLWVLGY